MGDIRSWEIKILKELQDREEKQNRRAEKVLVWILLVKR